MKTPKISGIVSQWGHKPVNIPSKSKANSSRKYLYNEVIDMVKKCKVPAEVSNEGIKLSMPNTNILNKLQEAGIYFETIG